MNHINRWVFLIGIAFLEGMTALFFYFRIPSEATNSGWLGYSTSRWFIGTTFILILILLFGGLIYIFLHIPVWENLSNRFNQWLNSSSHTWTARVVLMVGLLACVEIYLLSYLSLPIHLRPLILWLGLVLFETLTLSFWFFRKPIDLWAGWRSLEMQQRWIFVVLSVIGLIFFCLIIPQNLHGAETPHIFNVAVNDENVTYPPVLWMLKLTGKPEEWIYSLIVYEDYHYGYPFYFLSALVLLPIRLILGPNFGEQTQLNLLLLRQLISSLPILISSFLIVWMNTRFRSWWKSVLLFLLILFIPNAVFYQIRFWHPDGLVVLAVVLTLFFLSRDRYRLNGNFFMAAVFCGLASSIKLYGFFFVLSIAAYLLLCQFDGKIAWRRIFYKGILFIIIMFASILLSSPFLGVPSARERMMQIQNEKVIQLNEGYHQPGTEDIYHTGLEAWLPSLEAGFGPAFFLAFLTGSLVIGSIWGQRRMLNLLTLAWVGVIGFYLLYFSAVKSQHYWLPGMLPLYGSAINLADLSSKPGHEWINISPKIKGGLCWLCITAVLIVLIINLITTQSVFTEFFKP
jgi:hypothetical protein